jgi:hypothetical protein
MDRDNSLGTDTNMNQQPSVILSDAELKALLGMAPMPGRADWIVWREYLCIGEDNTEIGGGQ